MQFSSLEKITLERGLVYLLIFAVIIAFGFIFYLFFGQFTKSIQITGPKGGENWEIGKAYEITWKATGVNRVGIVLFKGKEPQWIAKNVYAGLGKYEWKIPAGHQYGDDYWVSVFEYPYTKDSKVAYTSGPFVISYPELASCDNLSITNEWPYAPSDLPNIRKVFITADKYTGKLGGFDGADKICQDEAQKQGFSGKWQALIGGDNDDQTATDRLKTGPRKLDGIFIAAAPEATLIRGASCHRVLGKNFDEFKNKFSDLALLNKERLGNFLADFGNIWLGRLDSQSRKNCAPIASVINNSYVSLWERYSFTATCQNWTVDGKFADGYSSAEDAKTKTFPVCYTPAGQSTKAVVLGGLASGLTGEGASEAYSPYQGKYCSEGQKLMCVEE